jgi:hypothetical protein
MVLISGEETVAKVVVGTRVVRATGAFASVPVERHAWRRCSPERRFPRGHAAMPAGRSGPLETTRGAATSSVGRLVRGACRRRGRIAAAQISVIAIWPVDQLHRFVVQV